MIPVNRFIGDQCLITNSRRTLVATKARGVYWVPILSAPASWPFSPPKGTSAGNAGDIEQDQSINPLRMLQRIISKRYAPQRIACQRDLFTDQAAPTTAPAQVRTYGHRTVRYRASQTECGNIKPDDAVLVTEIGLPAIPVCSDDTMPCTSTNRSAATLIAVMDQRAIDINEPGMRVGVLLLQGFQRNIRECSASDIR